MENNKVNSTNKDLTDSNLEISGSEMRLKELSLKHFLKKSSVIAIPGILFYVSIIMLQAVNLIYIGKKYKNASMIKGIGLANLYMNCTMFSVVMGLVSGLDTLCSNALGEKKYKLMGMYKHRASIIAYIFTIIIVIIHIFTAKYVLGLFKVSQEDLDYACTYMYVCLIYIFFDVQSAVNFRFLNVINKAHVNFVISIVSCALHPLWNEIFINMLDLDIVGAGISFIISRFLIFLLTTLYINIVNPLPESNFIINKYCFRNLWIYLKFSFGSAILMCAEWWAYEIQALIATFISEDDYTVHILIAQLCSLLYSVCVGFGLATTIIVGEYITKTSTKVANKAAWWSLIFGITVMLFVLSLFIIFKDSILYLFIDDDKIIEMGKPVIIVLCITEIFDIGQSIMSSIFRALGKQVIASVLSLFNFYVVMTTCSIIFGIVLKQGVIGLWYGINLGCLFSFILYLFIYSRLDLDKIQDEIRERLVRDQDEIKKYLNEQVNTLEKEKLIDK